MENAGESSRIGTPNPLFASGVMAWCLTPLLWVVVLSRGLFFPPLFLIVINSLIGRLRDKNCGTSLQGFFLGAAVHADDVRTVASCHK